MTDMVQPLQRSRLGRGLASLIGEPALAQPRLPPEGEQRIVAIDQVRSSGLNPRKDFRQEELGELAESIRQKGIVQPIVVRSDPTTPGSYEIVAGERRWRAAQMAGLAQVPVIVRDLTDRDLLELAIIENVQRADLNAIEEASGYQELINRFGYTQDKLAEVIGKSRSHLANTLRLLKLPDTIQTMVATGRLTAGHARALIGRDDSEALAHRIIERNMNVREVEALVQAAEAADDGSLVPRRRDKDADTRAVETELMEALGLKIELKRGAGETGQLTIRFTSFDQLEMVRQRLLATAH